MKKIMCTAVACSLMLCGMVGCGKDDDSKGASGKGFDGKWECSEMTANGTTVKELPLFNIPLSAVFQIEIKDNGTYIISSGLVGDEENLTTDSGEGKWEKVDDDTIKFLKPEGSTASTEEEEDDDSSIFDGVEFDLKGENLVVTISEDGQEEELKFKRVSEFSTYDMNEMEFSMSASIDASIDANFEDGSLDASVDFGE